MSHEALQVGVQGTRVVVVDAVKFRWQSIGGGSKPVHICIVSVDK